ncbi:MAG: GAF domain-containing sensor histidine kinase [Solirubrobacteraceae bacterium]
MGAHDIAAEQAALRRVATLVARAVPPHELFAAVAEEVGQLLGAEYAGLNRYEPDGVATTIVGLWGIAGDPLPAGDRLQILGGNNVITNVYVSGSAARVDGYPDSAGQLGLIAREHGVGSGVGTPIVVEGRLWGVMGVYSTLARPLPADTEERLASFTELVATAIANAESRARLARLADEQAALRRVATLVAGGTPPDEVFEAVTEEIGQLLPVDFAILGRYDSDGSGTSIATWGTSAASFPAGSRWNLEGNNLATIVFETGCPARNDGYTDVSGPIGETTRKSGFRSGVATPITVEGRLWGVVVAGSLAELPLPADTEARLGSFTELVATTIANAESRARLARLADEQAALRRVATLVARGVPQEQLFAAVTDEIARLLPVDFVHMGRYEPDDLLTVLATSGTTTDRFPIGTRLKLGGRNLSTIVFETGRSGRIDGYADAVGPFGEKGRDLGIQSSAGTPIIVEDRVWGIVTAGTTTNSPLPADTETRLASFTELVATAIANADSRAALAASRTRIVAAADESRRRLERDLHDGAQQRLVHTVIVLKLALQSLAKGDPNAVELVTEALRHAEQANSELRELAHGILPAALSRGGLRAGVDALVSRVSLPVSVDVSAERFPGGLEATAYFVVSEALTNVVKHARAKTARVTARVERGELRVEVRDDGVGGARGGHGSGLGGLADRVAALDGSIVLESPPGGGTVVCALLPLPARD